MTQQPTSSIRTSVYAATALAFAGIGDAFLYPFLPVNAIEAGVSLAWVGVLLSINRFVRIFTNTWMVHLFARDGLRYVTLLAVALAILSTAGYAFATSVVIWIILRIIWGLSFSALRIGTIGYALQCREQGFALGLSRGIQEAGPLVVLFLAPVLLRYLQVQVIFVLLAGLSLPALYFAWKLPKGNDRTPSLSRKISLHFPSTFNCITFVSAFLIDGVIVIVLGVLFLHHHGNLSVLMATTLAALYLGYRRICVVAFSPAGGWMSDKFGLNTVFTLSLTGMIVGLLMLVSGYIEAGSIVVFTFYSINAAITPGNLSKEQEHPLRAVAENATWRDIGAATGTLAGGVLLTSALLTPIIAITIFVLMLLLFIHMGTVRKAINFFYSWK